MRAVYATFLLVACASSRPAPSEIATLPSPPAGGNGERIYTFDLERTMEAWRAAMADSGPNIITVMMSAMEGTAATLALEPSGTMSMTVRDKDGTKRTTEGTWAREGGEIVLWENGKAMLHCTEAQRTLTCVDPSSPTLPELFVVK
jgi:hypothetical protein